MKVLIPKAVSVCLLMILTLLFSSCAALPLEGFPFLRQTNGALNVRSWAYQLQGIDDAPLDLNLIQQFPVDLVVIDYSRDGSEFGEFRPEEISTLKQSGKRVLAYMPIGAADAGRFYDKIAADSSPFSASQGDRLLGLENEDFPGTFFVKFWTQDWQDILFGNAPLPEWVGTLNPNGDNYLERILDAGYDGVYSDDIDGYQQFDSISGDGSRPFAAMDMLLLIQAISNWAKLHNPEFLVFPQNGENLFNDALEGLDSNGDGVLNDSDFFVAVQEKLVFVDTNRNLSFERGDVDLSMLDINRDDSIQQDEIETSYFASINGLGAEDFFFKGDKREDNPFIDTLESRDSRIEDFKYTAENYSTYADHAIPIFNVEYLTDSNLLGNVQYCQVFSTGFEFSNPAIIADTQAPAVTRELLESLDLKPFQAPSRDLSSLPSVPFSERCPSSQSDAD